MKKSEKNIFLIINAITILIGVFYAITIYFLKPQNPWDVINHPSQTYLQDAHIVFSPFLVFALGYIWHCHIKPKIEMRELFKRKSGYILIYTFIGMVISGYLIQVSTQETVRNLVIALHLLTSGVWIVFLLFHLC